MIKLSQAVEASIQKSPFIKEALLDGLINVSALSRRIQPDIEKAIGKPVQLGSIVMAVKRLNLGKDLQTDRHLHDFFKKIHEVSVRTNLIDYTFQNSPTLITCQQKLLNDILESPEYFFTFSTGIRETNLVASLSLNAKIKSIFRHEDCLSIEQNLASISIMLPKENRILFGVYYSILRPLAWAGINLIEVISTSNEFTIIVKEEELQEAFQVINRIRQ